MLFNDPLASFITFLERVFINILCYNDKEGKIQFIT